ncbi:mCG1050956 [Mus musculus]|nr:mCG1050956 [Mus musculus]
MACLRSPPGPAKLEETFSATLPTSFFSSAVGCTHVGKGYPSDLEFLMLQKSLVSSSRILRGLTDSRIPGTRNCLQGASCVTPLVIVLAFAGPSSLL